METVGDNLGEKKSKKENFLYNCDICDVKFYSKFNFDRHIMTPKHTKKASGDTLVTDVTEKKEQKEKNSHLLNYTCVNCNKVYSSRNGLWKHNKVCKTIVNNNTSFIDKDNIIMLLLKENSEFKNIMIEQQNTMLKIMENGTTNNSHNTTKNSHNKTFNLHFFLNETCKDAMNIMDFVDSIKLQLTDLEKVCDIGYTQGISDIITTNLTN